MDALFYFKKRKVGPMDMKMILWAQQMMQDDYGKIVIWLGFILILMALDLITGIMQAYANKDLKSGKMSTGLIKKFALLLVLIGIVPLTIILPEIVSVAVIISVYFLEMVNELLSIVENLNKMGIAKELFNPIMKRLEGNQPDKSKEDKNNG